MRASLAWLGEYVDIKDLEPQEVARYLTMAGLEVEDLRDRFAFLDKVVASRILLVEPFGQHLSKVKVDAGSYGAKVILCGAPDLEPGQIRPLALLGAELPMGPIKAKIINGFSSEGMLCSEAELGLGVGSDGLMSLSADLVPGTPLSGLYDRHDWVMEISVTPNRADALCILGLARDLAAVLDRPLIWPRVTVSEVGPPAAGQAALDNKAPEHALRYYGRVINGVTPGPSPMWLVERLQSVGLRSINNLVDITNFVMLEMGLPLHAFDLDKLAGRRIEVQLFSDGFKFTTLDGQERELKISQNIMICDGEKPVALAGIMGGLNSEVEDSTRNIFLEGACFHPASIRRTSKSLNLSTDASYRFERGTDINVCPLAVDRAAALMAELAGGVVAQGALDAYPKIVEPVKTVFSPVRCNKLLGTDHKEEDMLRVLKAIGVFLCPEKTGEYSATLPTWRPDLGREVDLFEEVVRLLDFEKLPARLPKAPALAPKPPQAYRLREKLRDFLSARGYAEHINYSFISSSFASKLSLPTSHQWQTRLVSIVNPLSEDMGVLRPSLIPGLLGAVKLNQNHGQWQAALFEVGNIFLTSDNEKPEEIQTLAGILSGTMGSGFWCDKERVVDFWDLKGLLENLATTFGHNFSYKTDFSVLPPFLDPSEAAVIWEGERFLGYLGLLDKKVSKAFGLKSAGGPVYLFELDIEGWHEAPRKEISVRPRFPGMTRDLALLLDRDISAQEVLEAISGEIPCLAGLSVFDLYEGEKLPEGKKSLALHLFFQDQERTLTDELVTGYFNSIVEKLSARFSAELRQ